VSWPTVVLLVAAAALSAGGAVAARGDRRDAAAEVRARRAVVGLVLMATAVAPAAVAGALLGAGRTGPGHVAAFVAVTAAVGLPLLVVGLGGRRQARSASRSSPPRSRGWGPGI
jgi:hypothetical protein